MFSLGDRAQIVGKFAQSHLSGTPNDNSDGTAYRFEASGEISDNFLARAYLRSADSGFINTATTSFRAGQTRWGAELSALVGENTQFDVQYDQEENRGTAPAIRTGFEALRSPGFFPEPGAAVDNSLTTIRAGVQQQLGSAIADLAYVYRDRTDRIGNFDATSSQLVSGLTLPLANNLSFRAQNELNLGGEEDPIYPGRTVLGLDYQPFPEVTVRLAQQFFNNNDIRFNGRRLRRPGIYLMGSGHEVTDNYIAFQPGPGVVIAAHPNSTQNIVRTNTFRRLDGLSLDLVYHEDTQVSDYQFGDGPNPPRNSNQRRKDSANLGINASEFDAYVFPISGSDTLISGKADAGSEIDLYQVESKHRIYGELGELITTVSVSADGIFSTTLALPAGTRISAIATDPRYGSSEPSPVAAIGTEPPINPRQPYQPVCQDPPPPVPPTPSRPTNRLSFAFLATFTSPSTAPLSAPKAPAFSTKLPRR